MPTQPDKDIIGQYQEFNERQIKKREQAKIDVEAAKVQRRRERAAARARERAELKFKIKMQEAEQEFCDVWADAHSKEIDDALDRLDDSFTTIEGYGMIGEDEPSTTHALNDAYEWLFKAFGKGESLKVNLDKCGTDELLADEIAEFIRYAEEWRRYINEMQFQAVRNAAVDLFVIANFLEKDSRGLHEQP